MRPHRSLRQRADLAATDAQVVEFLAAHAAQFTPVTRPGAIFNDATSHLYHVTMEWFAAAGHAPRARIELNYDAAIRSLVIAGYGCALLPLQASTDAALSARAQVLPLSPKLTRRLGIAPSPTATRRPNA